MSGRGCDTVRQRRLLSEWQVNYSLPVQANLNDFGIRLGFGKKNVCELEESSKELRNVIVVPLLQDISSEGLFFKQVHTYYVTAYH